MKITRGTSRSIRPGTVLILPSEEYVEIVDRYNPELCGYRVAYLEMDGDGTYMSTGDERHILATELVGAEVDVLANTN